MLSESDLALRRTGITATDIVILAGESPHGKTMNDVWADKCCEPQPESSDPVLSLGNDLEPVILARAAQRLGLEYMTRVGTHRSGSDPTALATVDALAKPIGADVYSTILEAKLVGTHMASRWSDGVPDYVTIQVVWQMYVTGKRTAYAVRLCGTEERDYSVDYDHELVEGLVDIKNRFWRDYVQPRRMPPVEASASSREMLQRYWPRSNGKLLAPTWEVSEAVHRYDLARRRMKAAKEEMDGAAHAIQAMLGEHEGMISDEWKVTWKEVPATVIKSFTKKAHRRFLVKLKGEENESE